MTVNGRRGSEQQLLKLVERYEVAAARAFEVIYHREGNLREWIAHLTNWDLVTQREDEVWHSALVLRNGIVSGNAFYTDVKLKYLRGAIGRMRPLVNKVERAVAALVAERAGLGEADDADRDGTVVQLRPPPGAHT